MRIIRHPSGVSSVPSALAIGNFDGVHLGHQAIFKALLAQARQQHLLPAVMTFEPHPRELFSPGEAPARLTSLREKLEFFATYQMACCFVYRFNRRLASLSAQVFMSRYLRQALKVNCLLVGDDFRFGAKREGNVAMLRQYGFEVFTVPELRYDGMRISSTAIRAALQQGDLTQARLLLGREYSISGRVVHGDKLGRQLGYPTANVQMHHNKPPLTGIYAVKLTDVSGEDFSGVASLGFRPTVKQGGSPTLEVYLFDFDRELYGQHVRVHFLKKIREEQRFDSLQLMKQQMALDEQAARDYFAK